MSELKVGQVWQTATPYKERVEVTELTETAVSYRYTAGECRGPFTRERASFAETFPILVGTAPPAKGWDYAEADRLRKAAAAACEAYNEYIQRKPDTYYPPIYCPADL
ncbi:hypothetical protein [Pantoea phage LIMEzero]|uniref:Uncharacterized protein n=1 Tax=Pantoea phage LIMEzero TaxID=943335 RepID=F4N9S2_9CAUD|nr:hypothetical protein LIMEzero_ORF19 [Pantoea phage LIMEzero]CBY88550.1 hypothetical protein [Pantoea phage LIMEzero]